MAGGLPAEIRSCRSGPRHLRAQAQTIRVLARRNREIQPLARLKHLATERGEALLNAMFRSPGSTLESRLRNVGKLSARNIERRHACCTSLIFQCPAPPAKLFGTSRTGSRFS